MPLNAHQRIGFEVECADVTLNMARKTSNYYGLSDTYGVVIMETNNTSIITGAPLIQVVLEERKGRENPKIEIVTSPMRHSIVHLRRLKTYVNALADAAKGLAAVQWLAAANRVVYSRRPNTRRFSWSLGDDVFQVNGSMKNLLFSVRANARGSRLPQCNVDLYVGQFYTDTVLLKQMMDNTIIEWPFGATLVLWLVYNPY